MKKIIITAALMVTSLTTLSVVKPFTQDVYLHSDVEEDSARSIIKDIQNVGLFTKVNLVLESDGGLVRQENVIRRALGKSYNSEVLKFAASAAAMLFIGGDNRVMTEGSAILFHEARLILGKGLFVTITDLAYITSGHFNEKYIFNKSLEKMYLNVKMFKRLSGEEHYTKIEFAKDLLNFLASKASLKELKKAVDEMIAEHLKDIKLIAKKTRLSEKEVMQKIMIPNKDTIISAKEALKLGIATDIKEG
ncbi:MAG: hypothetical protein C0446_08460 [Chitinophaga sp.]|nr:hypothetical protein [Chitinophaga sp.]